MRPVLSLALLLAACTGGPGPDDPVVVLVSIDTLRADHVGLYGYGRSTTPNLDAYFGRGTVFEAASSPSPCTIPAVRQVLSGGYDRDPERPRLAEILDGAGWRTLASTSQHMFRYDAKEGEYARGFDTFEMQGPRESDRYGMSARAADAVVDRGIALLQGWPWDRGPTFLWLHLFDPHDPYTPPERHRHFDAGNPSTRSGDRRGYLMAERPDDGWKWMEAGHVFSPADVDRFVNLYDGEIAFADEQLGRFFRFLDDSGLSERALVVFWADHGEWLGEGNAWDHCRTLHQREIHVPLMVRDGAGGLGGATRVSAPVSTLDVLPTIVGRLGLPLPDGGYHGRDLAAPDPERGVLSFWREQRAVRRGAWKLQAAEAGAVGLFDVTADPAEERDLLGDHPEVAADLLRVLEDAPDVRDRVKRENEQTRELLLEIGYTED